MNKRDKIIQMGLDGRVAWQEIAVALAKRLDNSTLGEIADREGWVTYQQYTATINFDVTVSINGIIAEDHASVAKMVDAVRREVESTLDSLELRDTVEGEIEEFSEVDICSYHQDNDIVEE